MTLNPAEILRTFNMSQRLLVLIIMALVGSGTYIAVQYLRTDDCTGIAKENVELLKVITETSKLLREGSIDVAQTKSISDTGYYELSPSEIAVSKLDSVISIYKK